MEVYLEEVNQQVVDLEVVDWEGKTTVSKCKLVQKSQHNNTAILNSHTDSFLMIPDASATTLVSV